MKIKNTSSSESLPPRSVLGILANDSRDGGGRVTQEAKTEAGIEWHLLKPITGVIPAQAGIQSPHWSAVSWIPACAGMTKNTDSGLSKCHSARNLEYR